MDAALELRHTNTSRIHKDCLDASYAAAVSVATAQRRGLLHLQAALPLSPQPAAPVTCSNDHFPVFGQQMWVSSTKSLPPAHSP